MPRIYLSPSTQENNLFVNGGTEEQYMNLIADAMAPYLRSNGIQYTRNTHEMTAASSIRQANQGNYDFYLALHSNAAPEGRYGQVRGSIAFYFPTSTNGKRMADIIVRNLKTIYPEPQLVRAVPTTTLGEVRLSKAPAVLVEIAYHDNVEDANWIKNNINAIARNLVLSLTEYFGIPFISPQPERTGTVRVSWGNLNIRNRPTTASAVIGQAPNGATLQVLGSWDGWYVVNYNGIVGYASDQYISV